MRSGDHLRNSKMSKKAPRLVKSVLNRHTPKRSPQNEGRLKGRFTKRGLRFLTYVPAHLGMIFSGVAGGVFVWCLKKEGGPGAVPPGKFFIFLPKTMGFYKISCARKITKQKDRCRMRD